MRVLSLFSGIGGIDLGLTRAGMTIVGQVEIDDYCRQVLAKHWPNVKRLGDIKQVRGDEFGPVDLLAGGPPCQPFSVAGKRGGTADDRHLWPEMLRLVCACRPAWVLVENVAGLVGMVLDVILADLEAEGYRGQAFVVPACAVGAPHRRDRVWIVAHSDGQRQLQPQGAVCLERRWTSDSGEDAAHTAGEGLPESRPTGFASVESQRATRPFFGPQRRGGRATQSCLGRVLDGLPAGLHGHWPAAPGQPQHDWEPPRLARGIPNRTARLKALGNAVVPQVVEMIGRAILQADSMAMIGGR